MKSIRFLLILTLFVTVMTVACGGSDSSSSSSVDSSGDVAETDPVPVYESGKYKDPNKTGRVPNEGRFVRIVSPAMGDTFAEGEEIGLVVEFENFNISDEGKHWHYYVDGGGQIMIMDGFDRRIRDLAVGEHTIEVFISGSDHREFEYGDRIVITVE